MASPSSFFTYEILGDQILDNLWQGPQPESGKVVSMGGFDTLVLCGQDPEYEYKTDGSSFPGVTVLFAPNDDDPRKPLTHAKLRVAILAAQQVAYWLLEGKKVLVTCYAGLNRSGLVSALALHYWKGWSGAKCVELIQLKRHNFTFTPSHALQNDEFVTYLNRIRPAAPYTLAGALARQSGKSSA